MSREKKLINLVVDRYVNLELFNRNQTELTNGCWEWTGVKNNIGYGFIGFVYADRSRGKKASNYGGMMTAHRLAFMIEHNRMPAARNVNHNCHNKLCVNPAHLSEGTQQQKLKDMCRDGIKGGRQLGQTGLAYNHKQENRVYKYSEEDIQWMRTARLEDIQAKYNYTREQARRHQWSFRRGYGWLPAPCEYELLKRGRKPGTTK
jgi:hypothetical protein